MNGVFSVYRISDGTILRTFTGDKPETQCGPGESFVVGRFASQSERIDPDSGKVVAVTPVPRTKWQEWDESVRQFRPTAAAFAIRDAISKIVELEASQPRILRERDLGDMTLAEARTRLRAINDQIVALRQIITDNGG